MLASPGLLKLLMKHSRHRTRQGKDLFPAISSLLALKEPEEAAGVLPEMRPLHPSPPCLQLPGIRRCEKFCHFSL